MCRVCEGPNVAKISGTEFWPNILVPAKEQVVDHVKRSDAFGDTCDDLAEIDAGLKHIAWL
jgi:hypothetical protein